MEQRAWLVQVMAPRQGLAGDKGRRTKAFQVLQNWQVLHCTYVQDQISLNLVFKALKLRLVQTLNTNSRYNQLDRKAVVLKWYSHPCASPGLRLSASKLICIKLSFVLRRSKPAQAEERVLQFMSVHNRPWNALLVSDHLAQFGVKKAQVQRALDALCESRKLMCKEFGKAKLYLPLQPAEAGLAKEVEHMHSV